jgi:hypothetical protein
LQNEKEFAQHGLKGARLRASLGSSIEAQLSYGQADTPREADH